MKIENSHKYPTNGLFIILGILENVVTKCSRFKGNTMDIFLDKKEYNEDLFTQLKNIEMFIKNHLNLRGEIKGLQRIDIYEIPEVAIRETLVNAIVHRDYSNLGSDIKVAVYDNKIEVVSPGGLPNGLTNEDILTGRSEVKNRVIARIFKELNYIEQWGSGINRINSSCLKAGLKEPFIEETSDFVGVRLFRKELVATDYDGLSKELKIILDYLRTNNSIQTKIVKEILDVMDTKAKEILKEMSEKKGKGRGTDYVIKDNK